MKLLIFLTTSFILVSCATTKPIVLPPKPIVLTKYVYPDCKNPPQRAIIELHSIHWSYLYDDSGDVVYTLTPKGYEDLSFNTSEIIMGAKELKAEIAYYLKCIEAPNDG